MSDGSNDATADQCYTQFLIGADGGQGGGADKPNPGGSDSPKEFSSYQEYANAAAQGG
jgi:hypothetical protein